MYANKKLWLNRGVIAFSIFLNASIIAVAYKYSHIILGLLVVSIPLLIIGVYRMIRADYLDRKLFIKKREALMHKMERGIQWLPQLMYPNKITKSDLYVLIGNEQCNQPCKVCVLNIRTNHLDDHLEIGRILNPQEEWYSKNSSVHRITGYRIQHGGCVLQIDLNHLFWRNKFGQFNSKIFKEVARRPEIKMIELKLDSMIQSKDFIFPSSKTVDRTSETRYSNIFEPTHGMFCHAEGVIHFLENLRDLSGGKPVGIKVCDIEKRDLHETCHAIQKTQIIPDFIVVESSDKETGSIGTKLRDGGTSLYEALLRVSDILEIYSLKNRVKIVAVGRIFYALDMLKMLALGANLVYTKTDDYNVIEYPVEGSNKARVYKSQTVDDFHKSLMEDTVLIMKSCGFKSISDLDLLSFFSNLDIFYSKRFKELNVSIPNPVFGKEANSTRGKVPKMRTEQSRKHEVINN
jgi:hypothetical protein